MVAAERIVAVISPDSSPVKRLIQDAKDGGRVIDVSCGRRTRAVLILDSDHVLLSAIQPETIVSRMSGEETELSEDDVPEELPEKTKKGKTGKEQDHDE